jgi:hypothetical protein
MAHKTNDQFNFKNPAVYKIVIKGEIDKSWSDNLLGMQVEVRKREGNIAFTSLVGEIRDQSALSGLLNNLYEMQMTVLSVNMLSDTNKDE